MAGQSFPYHGSPPWGHLVSFSESSAQMRPSHSCEVPRILNRKRLDTGPIFTSKKFFDFCANSPSLPIKRRLGRASHVKPDEGLLLSALGQRMSAHLMFPQWRETLERLLKRGDLPQASGCVLLDAAVNFSSWEWSWSSALSGSRTHWAIVSSSLFPLEKKKWKGLKCSVYYHLQETWKLWGISSYRGSQSSYPSGALIFWPWDYEPFMLLQLFDWKSINLEGECNYKFS